MEDVQLVRAHPGDDPLEGVDAEVVATGVEEEASVRERRGVADRCAFDNLKR